MEGTNLLNNMFEGFSKLPLSDKEYFLEVIKKRIIEEKRNQLALRVKEAEENYSTGNVKKGNADDFLKDLDDD
jgi:hypothetical protein